MSPIQRRCSGLIGIGSNKTLSKKSLRFSEYLLDTGAEKRENWPKRWRRNGVGRAEAPFRGEASF